MPAGQCLEHCHRALQHPRTTAPTVSLGSGSGARYIGGMTMADNDVLLVEIADYVALLTLNRPAVMNAIDRSLAEVIARTLPTLSRDPAVRVALVTGSG